MFERIPQMKRKLWDLTILCLTVYVLLQFSLEIILPIDERAGMLFRRIDFAICMLFLTDWIYYLILAQDKKHYLKTRSLDLAASIPFVQILRPLRFFRLVRIVRTLRLIRGIKATSPLAVFLFKTKSRSMLTVYLILTSAVYLYCSLGLYNFECGLNENIHGFSDVLWMSFTTITSVGYGDIYPVTGGGRVLAAVLVTTGMGLFSLLTAEFASLIIALSKKEDASEEL